ncbi:MAG: hypothetical protein E4H28_07890 [Gemmatimonadales bacterium]|nr:MAG: hypothetical protein E4H28_07890 [Gemmatimonadales bacterium]
MFDAGSPYTRLMGVTIDPASSDCVHTIAMATPSAMDRAPGCHGAVFRIEDGTAVDVTGGLPRLPLSMVVHPNDSSRPVAVLYERGVDVCEDRAGSWRELGCSGRGLPDSGFFSLIIVPHDPAVLYLVGGCDVRFGSFATALDFGEHREIWSTGWPGEQWVFRIAFDPRDPDVMVACSKNGENEGVGRHEFRGTVMKTTDGGARWFPITGSLSLDQEFYDIVSDPRCPLSGDPKRTECS